MLRRPLSIHRVGEYGTLALLFEVVGQGTKWLGQRRQGDVIDILGPLGNGFALSAESHDLLLVAGGMGIAPLVYLAERGLEAGAQVTLLLGAPTAEQVYPGQFLSPQVELQIATEDGSIGSRGTVTDLLSDFANGASQIFACGPIPMYAAMAGLDLIKGKRVQVSIEARMGCGFGGCYGCAIETKKGRKLVCKDGPVFQLDEIFW